MSFHVVTRIARSAVLMALLPASLVAQPLTPSPPPLLSPQADGEPQPFASAVSERVRAPHSGALTLTEAVRRALAANPRLTAAERDIGIAAGRRLQAGAVPNPELSFELDNAFGSGPYRGLRSAESTLQLSQLIELGGKREARIAAGSAEVEACLLRAGPWACRKPWSPSTSPRSKPGWA